MFLKFLRLAHANEVSQSLKRLLIDYLSEIFYLQMSLLYNLYNWINAAFKLVLVMYYFAAGWVFITNVKVKYGEKVVPYDESSNAN